ncbi:MAG: hypothetical protein EOP49_22940 [Sphingobacteriales bacterium]|nr:MAG: hypothetical protein EOP49_22940 [Sphingobacteriales bacterium]
MSLKGMGSISTGYASSLMINTDNPASYTALRATTYEAGGEGSVRTVISGNNTFSTGTATLSYITIGIPAGKNGGIAFGLRPNTRVYYRMHDTANLAGLGPSIRSYDGEGGTNYAFLGGAWRYKDFSIGMNFGYMFGTIRNSSLIQKLYDSVNSFNSDFSRYKKVGGIYWKAGAQYYTPISKDKKMAMRVGATVALGQDLNVWQDEYAILYRSFGGITVADTAISSTNVKGKINLPLSYGLGVHFMNTSNWMAGIDFTATNWSGYRVYGSEDSVTNMAYKIAVGGEYTPDPTSINHYLQRVSYRLGFYYGRDYIRLQNTDMNYYAVTAGASLPFRRSTDRIHLGLEVGSRGTNENGLIKENFLKFSLGISLNDFLWFQKRKYD